MFQPFDKKSSKVWIKQSTDLIFNMEIMGWGIEIVTPQKSIVHDMNIFFLILGKAKQNHGIKYTTYRSPYFQIYYIFPLF